MNRARLYAALRRSSSGIFGTSLSQAQVQGTEAILDSCIRNRVTDPHHVANVLSNVYRETGGYMSPIKETVYASHKNKSPSDATVKARLENAWKSGKLSWVKTPYWRDGWFGRGPIQTTHRSNYLKMSNRLGVDLIKYPERLLEPKIGADSAVIGMAEGLYTGRKLSDYVFPDDLYAPPDHHPRRIVNGRDGTDELIAQYHRAFHGALVEAGWTGKPTSAPTPSPRPDTAEKPKTPSAPTHGGKKGIIGLIVMGIATAVWFFIDKIVSAFSWLLGG